MGDVVSSWYTWLALLLCFVGGLYAKRTIFGALVVTAVAPTVLMAVWMMMAVVNAFLSTFLIWCVGLFFAGFPHWIEGVIAGMPKVATHLFHPATLATAAGFLLYCWYERGNTSPPPKGFSSPDGRGYIGQPMRDPEPKFNPGMKRFRS